MQSKVQIGFLDESTYYRSNLAHLFLTIFKSTQKHRYVCYIASYSSLIMNCFWLFSILSYNWCHRTTFWLLQCFDKFNYRAPIQIISSIFRLIVLIFWAIVFFIRVQHHSRDNGFLYFLVLSGLSLFWAPDRWLLSVRRIYLWERCENEKRSWLSYVVARPETHFFLFLVLSFLFMLVFYKSHPSYVSMMDSSDYWLMTKSFSHRWWQHLVALAVFIDTLFNCKTLFF